MRRNCDFKGKKIKSFVAANSQLSEPQLRLCLGGTSSDETQQTAAGGQVMLVFNNNKKKKEDLVSFF